MSKDNFAPVVLRRKDKMWAGLGQGGEERVEVSPGQMKSIETGENAACCRWPPVSS